MKTLKVNFIAETGLRVEVEHQINNIRFVKGGFIPCSKEDADAIICDVENKHGDMESNCFWYKINILNWDEL